MSFRLKVLIMSLAYGFILSFSIYLLSLELNKDTLRKESIKRSSQYALETEKKVNTYLKDITLKLDSIESSNIFNKYYNTKEINPILNSLFLDVSNTADNIMQLRFIDTNGFEKIRIDRNSYASKPFIVQKYKLQNKKNRYYFKDIYDLQKGKYWFSKIDLNMEYGEIELPLKPVLRVGKVVYKKNKKIGILIINIFMDKFLNNIMNTKLYNMVLLDKDGYTIVESAKINNWCRYLDHKKLFESKLKDDLNNIISNDDFTGKYFYSTKIHLNNSENIKLVVIPKLDYFKIERDSDKYNVLWILLGSILLSFPLSYFMAKLLSKYKKEVEHLNTTLDNEIDEKDVLLSLYQQSNSILFRWNNDEKRTVSSVSDNVKGLIGYTKEEFESNEVIYSECIHEDDLPKALEELKKAIKYNQSFVSHKPYRIITKSGDEKWVLGNTLIVKDKNDQIVKFVGYITDISH